MTIERNFENGKLMFSGDVIRIASVIMQFEPNWSHFKIGKTGNTADKRFQEPDYNGVYDGIIEVYASTSKELVSKMEAALIDYFIDDPKCDNGKDGERSINDTMTDSDRYIVYVVYKNRRKLFS